MANDRIERQLERIREIRGAGRSDEAILDLRKALADKVNVLVAKAAAIAAAWQAKELLPDVKAAWERLFLKLPESDPQCTGKLELARCMKELGVAEAAVYLRGAQHHQLEATWGGKIDTAGPLRGTCALALVQCADVPRHEILMHLVNAATEEEAVVRVEAVRALEQMGGREVALLLRMKARCGDKEPRVMGQVFEALIQMEGAGGIGLVAEFLNAGNSEQREEAALALGASRMVEGVEVLKEAFERTGMRRDGACLLRAISASRLDVALEFLLELVKRARMHTAEEALRALELHKESEEIVKRIGEVVGGRGELEDLFREIYLGGV